MTKFFASLAAATMLMTLPAFAATSTQVGAAHTSTPVVAHHKHHRHHNDHMAAKKMKHTKAMKSSKSMKSMKAMKSK
jgi:hypothetical protein